MLQVCGETIDIIGGIGNVANIQLSDGHQALKEFITCQIVDLQVRSISHTKDITDFFGGENQFQLDMITGIDLDVVRLDIKNGTQGRHTAWQTEIGLVFGNGVDRDEFRL